MKFTLEHMYYLTGVYLILFAVYSLMDKTNTKKIGNAAFWAIYGVTFLFGKVMPAGITGILVVVMALLACFKCIGRGSYQESSFETKEKGSVRHGNMLFYTTLIIPLVTFGVAKFTSLGALVGLGIGSLAGLVAVMVLTKEGPGRATNEGRRLIDAIGWAAILSQFLAALGFLFDKAGVGSVVANIVSSLVPTESALASVIAYCVGMALFTMIMGNAFAAFAVITTGIGIPLVIQLHGGNPAIVGVIAMLSGYCGTLMTPMAANFNVVPAALLEMKDKNKVIKTQVATAILVLCVNIALMYFLGF